LEDLNQDLLRSYNDLGYNLQDHARTCMNMEDLGRIVLYFKKIQARICKD